MLGGVKLAGGAAAALAVACVVLLYLWNDASQAAATAESRAANLNDTVQTLLDERELLSSVAEERRKRADALAERSSEARQQLEDALNENEELRDWYRRRAHPARVEFLRLNADQDSQDQSPD